MFSSWLVATILSTVVAGAPLSTDAVGSVKQKVSLTTNYIPYRPYFTCKDLTQVGRFKVQNGVHFINLPSGEYEVYCEMGINGGGYTFLSSEMIPMLQPEDMKYLFTDSTDVLLRISKPDGTQPYTVISQFKNTGGVSVQLSDHTGYQGPVNKNLGPYIFLGLLPASAGKNNDIQGFKSNGKTVTFKNGDKNPNSQFFFYPNPRELKVSDYYRSNSVYEKSGVCVNWRGTAVRPNSNRRIPLRFFMLTEMHFGGGGCYSSSERWMNSVNPALGTAIGVR